MYIFKWDLKSLSFTLIVLLKEFHSNYLISCSTCNMNQPLPGVCTLNLKGFDWWTVLVCGVSCALYTILLCFALQEITNILKCLASVVHIGNISFGAINQEPNSAFVKDPQPVHCGKVLRLLITIECCFAKINCITPWHGSRFLEEGVQWCPRKCNFHHC